MKQLLVHALFLLLRWTDKLDFSINSLTLMFFSFSVNSGCRHCSRKLSFLYQIKEMRCKHNS